MLEHGPHLQQYAGARATGISADGSVIVGNVGNPIDCDNGGLCYYWPARAVQWIGGQSAQSIFGNNPQQPPSSASAVSADGAVVVGWRKTPSGSQHAFRLAEGVLLEMGSLPGDEWAEARAVSGDGSVVVGASGTAAYSAHAFLWTVEGMVDLNDYLPALGIDLTGWTLTQATGVSADGLTVTGNGTHNGATEAWVASIGGSAPGISGDLDCDGVHDGRDIGPFLIAMLDAAAYDANYPNCDIALADLNGDGSIDGFDVEPFVQGLLFP
jgi:probable HAF family extracellular repeat protein